MTEPKKRSPRAKTTEPPKKVTIACAGPDGLCADPEHIAFQQSLVEETK